MLYFSLEKQLINIALERCQIHIGPFAFNFMSHFQIVNHNGWTIPEEDTGRIDVRLAGGPCNC